MRSPIVRAISTGITNFQILNKTADIIAGPGSGTSPAPPFGTIKIIPTTGVSSLTFVVASLDSGMGTFTIRPQFRIAAWGSTYAGAYSGTVTVTMVSGP